MWFGDDKKESGNIPLAEFGIAALSIRVALVIMLKIVGFNRTRLLGASRPGRDPAGTTGFRRGSATGA